MIGAAQVGLLAAVGRDKVMVHPRPRVSVMSRGGELVDIDRTPGHRTGLRRELLRVGAPPRGTRAPRSSRVGIVNGDPRKLREVVESRLLLSEIVVIAGGVGGAEGEEVRAALAELGDMDVTRVAIHPGSVQGFGRMGHEAVPTFLLPSNPISALVVFEVFVRPLIRAALGKPNPHRRVVNARLLSQISSTLGRRGYVRGQLLRDSGNGDYLVQPLGMAGAHLLASLAEANCLAVVDSEITELAAGDEVPVMFLSQRG